MEKLYGGMEGGGTKFVCAVGTGPEKIVEETRFATTNPQETLGQAIEFFKKFSLEAIGLAPFGPLDLNPTSASYGHITATPKGGWSNADIVGPFRQNFDLPLAFDLDVNAAAFGEYTWVPANRKLDSLVYFTIGTGIGAGVLVNGQVVHGLTHPEAGHIHLPHDWQKDPFPGSCPFHGDCFEGLANGPAIGERWGQPAESLSPEHPAWDLEADYIALAVANVLFTLSPQRFVLGGGVMGQKQLFPMIRNKVHKILNGYIPAEAVRGTMEEFIVPPGLAGRSGILGAIAMAKSHSEE